MKYFTILIMMFSLIAALPASAQAACETEQTVTVKVNGLICDFCARSLEKMFGQRDAVSRISVDLDKGLVTITLKPTATMEDAEIKRLITDSGYDVAAMERGC